MEPTIDSTAIEQQELQDAAYALLDRLDRLTTNQFQEGGERDERERLREALRKLKPDLEPSQLEAVPATRKQRFFIVLDAETAPRVVISTEDIKECLRDIVDIPQATTAKETYWIESAMVFEDFTDLQVAVNEVLL